MSRIIETCFPDADVGPPHLPAPTYHFTTKHAALFGGANGYILSADACLMEIAAFVSAEKVSR